MSILVIAAHPDDEVLGCGGTVRRLADEGQVVDIAILGEGMTARSHRRDQADTAALDILHRHCREVAGLLGARDLVMENLPDNRFDSMDMLDVVKVVEKLVSRFAPTVVYTHHGGDLNVDHRVVNQAVLTATRPMAGTCVREIFAFEVASSTEWSFQQIAPVFRPNVFVDIGQTLPAKIQAMSRYETEARPFPHPRSPAALEAIARRWGSVAGCPAAEAFELIRSIR